MINAIKNLHAGAITVTPKGK